jgi:hypothetical protein
MAACALEDIPTMARRLRLLTGAHLDACTGGVNGSGALVGECRGGGAGGLEARPHLMSSSILSDWIRVLWLSLRLIRVWMVKESFFWVDFWLLLWTSGTDGE